MTSPTKTRPLYWSIRRELWEHRSILVAPLVVTGVVLFGCLIGMVRLPHRIEALSTLEPARQHAAVVRTITMAPAPIMFAAFVVGLFFCLDALYGERRDRSILFWKSLPVSDLTTVLSKATVPMLVLPLVAFVLSLATQTVILFLSTVVLLGSRVSPAPLWAEFRFLQDPAVTLYGLAVHALWFAPIYGWLLLVSAWARRTPVLWAVLPFFAISILERMAFNTTHFASFLKYRVTGAMQAAFVINPQGPDAVIIDQLSQLSPSRFLGSPGLWLGLVAAAAFVAAAARLRRYREPI